MNRRRALSAAVLVGSLTPAIWPALPPMSMPTAIAGATTGYTLGPEFGTGGVVQLPTPWTDVRDIAVLADGTALVEVDRHDVGGATLDTGVAKLLPNGALDTTFAATSPTPGIADIGAPAGPLVAMADGHYFLGSRRYRADGSLDASYGANGYVALNGVMFGNTVLTLIETGNGHVSIVSNGGGFGGCSVFDVDAAGSVGPLTSAPSPCSQAVAVPLRDGSTAVVTHQFNGTYQLFRVDSAGAVMPALNGTYPDVGMPLDSAATLVAGVQVANDDVVILLDDPLQESNIARLGLDGRLDTTFGNNGVFPFEGTADAVTVDPEGKLVAANGYNHRPYDPALVSFTPRGSPDPAVNPGGVDPSWVHLSEVGFAVHSYGGPAVPFGDGIMLGVDTRPAAGVRDPSQWRATLLLVQSTSPHRVLTSIGNAATATITATRLGHVDPS